MCEVSIRRAERAPSLPVKIEAFLDILSEGETRHLRASLWNNRIQLANEVGTEPESKALWIHSTSLVDEAEIALRGHGTTATRARGRGVISLQNAPKVPFHRIEVEPGRDVGSKRTKGEQV